MEDCLVCFRINEVMVQFFFQYNTKFNFIFQRTCGLCLSEGKLNQKIEVPLKKYIFIFIPLLQNYFGSKLPNQKQSKTQNECIDICNE